MAVAGQADEAPGTTDDLAAFLDANPDADASTDPTENDDEPGDDPDNSDGDTNDDEPGPDADDDEAPEGDDDDDADPAKPVSGQKFKVTVKGEDGADVEQEVDLKELTAGYQRHADYTRKTMELSTQRAEVLRVAEERVNEGRTHYVQQATIARQAIIALAGIKTAAEMQELAQNNPGAWAAEKQRTEQIGQVLAEIEQGLHADAQTQTAAQQAAAREEITKAWGVLTAEGLDKPKLIDIFGKVHNLYGVPKERFQKVSDPALVLMMRDAVAFRELKDRAGKVSKLAAKAPKPAKAPLPAPRARVPANERQNAQLSKRFTRPGGAKVGDLAAWMNNNKL